MSNSLKVVRQSHLRRHLGSTLCVEGRQHARMEIPRGDFHAQSPHERSETSFGELLHGNMSALLFLTGHMIKNKWRKPVGKGLVHTAENR